MIGGFGLLTKSGVVYGWPSPVAMPVPAPRMNAQRICSAVASEPTGGWITAPVICVPARVGETVPVRSGIGDSSHFSV
jgi:hypothetical protein